MSLAYLLDIANIIFFTVGIPQMRSAYINRHNLDAISLWLVSGCFVACILFTIANSSFGAYIAGGLNIGSMIFYDIQMYWKLKYGNYKRKSN